MIFSFMRNEGFARDRSENFLVELEGGNGNKESWQDKIIQKLTTFHHICMHVFNDGCINECECEYFSLIRVRKYIFPPHIMKKGTPTVCISVKSVHDFC